MRGLHSSRNILGLFLLLSGSTVINAVPVQNSNESEPRRLQNSLVATQPQPQPPPASERFSRALATQFDSFKKEHPIQAKILEMVSDLLLRPSSVHSLLKSSGGGGGSGSGRREVTVAQPPAQDRIMGPLLKSGDEILLPQASSYQYFQQHPMPISYTSYSYPNVRRSGRFMFPDEYEEKVKRFEADQERSLGRSSFNNYHIINNQVRLGRVEAVQKPDVAVGVPFIPRGGGRSGRKFEPSPILADTSPSSDTFNLSGNKNNDGDQNPRGRNEFENFKNFGVLPQEPKPLYSEEYYPQPTPDMKSSGMEREYEDSSNFPKPSSEWTATTDDTFTKLRNPYEGQRPNSGRLQFRRPISVRTDSSSSSKIPVLRPMFRSTSGSGTSSEFNLNSNRITRKGKSLPGFDLGSSSFSQESDSEWQLLSTSGKSGERFVPSPPVGVGSVQIQPASAFSSPKEEGGGGGAAAKELPRVSKVMRPSTIRSQPLIVKDARDGRSLKEISVQGVKIIVGSKTPDFPKDIYMRNNYVRSLTPPGGKTGDKSPAGSGRDSVVDINVGSSITTL